MELVQCLTINLTIIECHTGWTVYMEGIKDYNIISYHIIPYHIILNDIILLEYIGPC